MMRKQALGVYVTRKLGWDESVQRDFHAHSYDPSQTHLIRQGDQTVGHMVVKTNADHILFEALHILPVHQHRGIGTLLLRHVISFAETLNLPVRLTVLRVNPATNLYQRLGFVVTGETDTHYAMERGLTHAH